MADLTSKNETILQNLNYLILEDDRFSRSLIKTALHQIGIRNSYDADTAIKAIDMMKTKNIDLILLDHEMAGVTGLEFARLVRNGEEGITNTDVPIIIITVDTKEETVMQAKEIEIQDYLIKPISPLSLKKRLVNAVIGKTADTAQVKEN